MSGNARRPVLTGGCQCGAVRYAAYAPAENVHVCHCRMCQKAVGGPFAALAPIRRADFAWTRGEPASFASSSIAMRDFCGHCGTPLTFRYIDGTSISVTIGSLDQPQTVTPASHYGVESKLAWLDQLATMPTNTTAASMSPDRRAKYVSHQHPDHD